MVSSCPSQPSGDRDGRDAGPVLAAEHADRGVLPGGLTPAEDRAGLPEDAAVAGLVATMRAVDRLLARAVDQARALDGAQAVREEGMDAEAAVRLHTGATRTDVTQVLGVAETLGRMPVTAELFRRGVLSWGHVRALCSGARHLTADRRAALDDHLREHAAWLAGLDGDGRLGAIETAIDRHTPPQRLADAEDRDPDTRQVILTPRLDGSGTLFGDLDVEGFSVVAERLEAEAATPHAAPSPGDDDQGIPARHRDGSTTGTRARLLADALVRVCEATDAGSPGSRVRMTVTVDAAMVCDSVAATIQTALAARSASVTRQTRDRLACDAAIDLVVRDGGELLATHRTRPDVTTAVRRAVAARDQGCRFPACRAPVGWCDVHHVVPRAAGEDHRPSNLVLLCRRHHTTVHRRGWIQSLTPDGTYHLRRRGRSWHTRPRPQHQLPPPASTSRHADDRAPPGGNDPLGGNDPPGGSDPPGRSTDGHPGAELLEPLPF